MKVHIIDDFLPKEEFDKLSEFITGKSIPWYYTEVVNSEYINCESDDNYQFSHTFYIDDQPAPFIDRVSYMVGSLMDIGARALVRVKANMTLKTDKIIEHGLHVDYPNFEGGKTAVYYVNTNNGYTKFESGDIIESLANRMVIFDGTSLHTGTTCTDQRARYVINFDFF